MNRVWPWLLAPVAAILAGGAAFSAIEHVPLTSALYWALVTAATVGYGDVTPNTPHGRLVATAVIIVAIPLLGYAYSRLNGLHVGKHLRTDLDDIKQTADKAHRIAADTYRHHTGRDHPDAPDREDTEHDAQDG